MVDLQIFDTLGQEKYDSLTNAFYRQSDAVMFVFDISNRESFYDISHWLRRAHENGCIASDADSEDKNFYYHLYAKYSVLVGNKSDLSHIERRVSYWEATLVASKFNLKYFETSVVENSNVFLVYYDIMKEFHLKESQMDDWTTTVNTFGTDSTFRLSKRASTTKNEGLVTKCCRN